MTTVSLRFSPRSQVNLTFGDVHLSPGVAAHRMTLPVLVSGDWPATEPTAAAPVLLIGTAWTDQPYFHWLAGIEPQVLTMRSYPTNEELVISLTDEQLIALERARGADDIGLLIKLQATLLTSFEGVHPITQGESNFRIQRARWLELLDHIGSEVGILVRVPSPLTDSAQELPPRASADDAASLTQAAARLRQARAELRDGQWEHSVATCRRVLENIARLVIFPQAKSFATVLAAERTQEQRWAAIYYDIKSMASAAHHDDGTTSDFVWVREDAEAMLAATAGLLRKFTSHTQ